MGQIAGNSSPNFCSECGFQVSLGSRFCGGCGKAIEIGVSDSAPPAHQEKHGLPVDFGIFRGHVKTCNWDFLASGALKEKPINLFPEFGRGSSKPTEDAMLDFVVTEDYFVVLKAPPPSIAHKVANKIAVNTMGLGLAGGAFALSTAFLGHGYQKILGHEKELSRTALVAYFESGHMMFARRCDVIGHELLVKEGFLSPTQYHLAIAANFCHVRHKCIDMAFYLWEGGALKSLEAAGLNIGRTGTQFSCTSSASKSLAPKYLDSVQHHAILAR